VGGHRAGATKLLGGKLREPGHDAGASGHGQQFDLHTPHPPHGRQLVHQQQVVGLIVEAPLADDQGGPGILQVQALFGLEARTYVRGLFVSRNCQGGGLQVRMNAMDAGFHAPGVLLIPGTSTL